MTEIFSKLWKMEVELNKQLAVRNMRLIPLAA
ncbi:hypothetical protein ABIE66_005835 [Peribacillus sp. B2I2]